MHQIITLLLRRHAHMQVHMHSDSIHLPHLNIPQTKDSLTSDRVGQAFNKVGCQDNALLVFAILARCR